MRAGSISNSQAMLARFFSPPDNPRFTLSPISIRPEEIGEHYEVKTLIIRAVVMGTEKTGDWQASAFTI